MATIKGYTPRSKTTALHEAAHAVVAHVLDTKVQEVVVTGANGYCLSGTKPPFDPLVKGLILMAGSAADHKWNNRPENEISGEDMDAMRGIGFSDMTFSVILGMSRKIVNKESGLIKHVARALEKDDLSRRQFLKVVREYGTQSTTH